MVPSAEAGSRISNTCGAGGGGGGGGGGALGLHDVVPSTDAN